MWRSVQRADGARAFTPLELLLGIALATATVYAMEFNAPEFATIARVFPVSIHEMGHALGCVLTGGHVYGMVILPEGGQFAGATWGVGGWDFLWTQTGYLGLTAFACLMLWLTSFPQRARPVLTGVGIVYGALALWFVGNPNDSAQLAGNAMASQLVSLAIAGGIIYGAQYLSRQGAYYMTVILAVFCAAEAELDLYGIWQQGGFFRGEHRSDAGAMQAATGIPAGAWILLWLIVTNLAFLLTLAVIRKRQDKRF